MSTDTIPSRLLDQADRHPAKPAYCVREAGSWNPTRFFEYSEQVTRVGRSLLALGFEPGQTVCILGANRPEWAAMDIAAMGVGGAPAGIYTTCSPAEVRYIITHANAPIALVEDNEAVVVGDRRPYLTALITIDPETGDQFAAAHGTERKTLTSSTELRTTIRAHLDEINAHFARVEQIKKFTILDHNFSVEAGELTPTLKVKRARVNDRYADAIEAMYAVG